METTKEERAMAMAVAAIAVAVVKTFDDRDPEFSTQFRANMEAVYRKLQDSPDETQVALQTLTYARGLLNELA